MYGQAHHCSVSTQPLDRVLVFMNVHAHHCFCLLSHLAKGTIGKRAACNNRNYLCGHSSDLPNYAAIVSGHSSDPPNYAAILSSAPPQASYYVDWLVACLIQKFLTPESSPGSSNASAALGDRVPKTQPLSTT
jgi:hypothetical protein